MQTKPTIEGSDNPSEEIYSDAYMYDLITTSRKHAWIVAAPKSGSTWLTVLLSDTLGWHQSALVPCYGRREQEADLRRLMFYPKAHNLLSIHQHCKFSDATLDLINKANIDVILQLRNIFDAVVSLRDHLTNESAEFPMAWMDEGNWKQLNDAQKLDFVIDMVVPWYFSFFVGWMQSELVQAGRAYVCTYERLRADPVLELQKILRFLKEERDLRFIERVVEGAQRKTTRLNKGLVGRSKNLLSRAHEERIIGYTEYYPTVDFGLLGICTSKPASNALQPTWSGASLPADRSDEPGRGAERRHVPGEAVSTPRRLFRLDLGCGRAKPVDFIGADRFPLPRVDVVLDLDYPLPFADDSVDLVLASHSLEHVADLVATMREIYRVCKHGAQVCIVAPYFHQGLNRANPYHFQCFNEHTPRFWTNSRTAVIDPVEYFHPHADSWGLAESDHSKPGIDFRCLRMEFFYFPEYRHLLPDQQRAARNKYLNVCDQIMYHLLVVKEPVTDKEVQELAKHMDYYEPPGVIQRRSLERCEGEINELRASLEAANAKLAEYAAERDETKSSLEAARHDSARLRRIAGALAGEVDSFRARRSARLVGRFREKSDWCDALAAPFEQLKDDSLIFTPGLQRYRLQPSISLHRVAFLQYPLWPGRPNLAGVSLAPLVDLPAVNGLFGIEVVSPANAVVLQRVVPASELDPAAPIHLAFPPIADSDRGQFELRVFVRDVDVPVRVLEWRRHSCLGLGRLQRRAFCAFHFDGAT